jgi:hypothetical protein
MLPGPQAINAGTTYGMDFSVDNNYGLGRNYSSAAQQTQAANVAAATTATFPIWVIGAIVALVLVAL